MFWLFICGWVGFACGVVCVACVCVVLFCCLVGCVVCRLDLSVFDCLVCTCFDRLLFCVFACGGMLIGVDYGYCFCGVLCLGLVICVFVVDLLVLVGLGLVFVWVVGLVGVLLLA